MKASEASQLADLADQIGGFIRYWGFKRVHGRIWAHLFLSEAPLDAGTLIKRLKVSKALMSVSLKELLKYKVITSAGRSEMGTLLYIANPDVTGVILNVLRTRERKMLERISNSHEGLRTSLNTEPSKHQLSQERLGSLGELIETGRSTVEAFLNLSRLDLEAWRKFQTP